MEDFNQIETNNIAQNVKEFSVLCIKKLLPKYDESTGLFEHAFYRTKINSAEIVSDSILDDLIKSHIGRSISLNLRYYSNIGKTSKQFLPFRIASFTIPKPDKEEQDNSRDSIVYKSKLGNVYINVIRLGRVPRNALKSIEKEIDFAAKQSSPEKDNIHNGIYGNEYLLPGQKEVLHITYHDNWVKYNVLKNAQAKQTRQLLHSDCESVTP